MKRLWVIDPSIREAEDEGVARILAAWPGESRVFHPGLRPEEGPGPGDGYDLDGVVVMGSAASVHDDQPGLEALSGWLRPLLEGSRAIPVFAICYGHQLVAHLAGASVGVLREDGSKECGIRETCLESSRLLPGRHSLRVVVSHREEVKTLPPGFRVIARRDGVRFDGLEHERLPIFTVQFHPEARDEFLRLRGLDPRGVDDKLIADSERLIRAFCRLVAQGGA
jgi:GMP synthase (glutamine-hydrolysing)